MTFNGMPQVVKKNCQLQFHNFCLVYHTFQDDTAVNECQPTNSSPLSTLRGTVGEGKGIRNLHWVLLSYNNFVCHKKTPFLLKLPKIGNCEPQSYISPQVYRRER